jgi:predicted nucleic-acid-binding Zn-ribbon protein
VDNMNEKPKVTEIDCPECGAKNGLSYGEVYDTTDPDEEFFDGWAWSCPHCDVVADTLSLLLAYPELESKLFDVKKPA